MAVAFGSPRRALPGGLTTLRTVRERDGRTDDHEPHLVKNDTETRSVGIDGESSVAGDEDSSAVRAAAW